MYITYRMLSRHPGFQPAKYSTCSHPAPASMPALPPPVPTGSRLLTPASSPSVLRLPPSLTGIPTGASYPDSRPPSPSGPKLLSTKQSESTFENQSNRPDLPLPATDSFLFSLGETLTTARRWGRLPLPPPPPPPQRFLVSNPEPSGPLSVYPDTIPPTHPQGPRPFPQRNLPHSGSRPTGASRAPTRS